VALDDQLVNRLTKRLGLHSCGNPARPEGQRGVDSFAGGMSGFTKLSLEDLEDPRRSGPGRLALGRRAQAMTASWITQLSMEPVLMGVGVDNTVVACGLIFEGASFTDSLRRRAPLGPQRTLAANGCLQDGTRIHNRVPLTANRHSIAATSRLAPSCWDN